MQHRLSSASGHRRSWLRPAALCVLGLSLGCSRAAPSSQLPIATLSLSSAAQKQFQPLRRSWQWGTWPERAALETRLRGFIEQHSGDPVRAVAQTYLALLLVQKGKTDEARRLVHAIRLGSQGNTRDLATLVEGAALDRMGQHEGALHVLIPLSGKMLDSFAQSLVQETLVEASVGAHRWFEAVAHMDQWLRTAETGEREGVRKRVDALLERMPSDSLLYCFLAIQNSTGTKVYGKEIRTAIAERIAAIAARGDDPLLTQGIAQVSKSGSPLGQAGSYFFRLGNLSANAPRVSGATLGIAAPQYSNLLRARSSQTVVGVVSVLGPRSATLPRDGAGLEPAPSASTVIQEIKQDDSQSTQQAMSALLRDGASLIVAGFDETSARYAAAFAESHSVPVLLLSSPGKLADGARFTFVLGPSDEERGAAIAQAFDAAVSESTVQVGYAKSSSTADFESCEREADRPGDPRFPMAAWKKAKVSALMLTGPESCANAVLEEASLHRFLTPVFCGLDSAWSCFALPAGRSARWLSAGAFGATQRDGAVFSDWVREHSAKPTWFAALGRDAAVLAQAAMAGLADDDTSDPEEVSRRHALVQQGLAAATVSLWTTDATGFASTRQMRRELLLESAPR